MFHIKIKMQPIVLVIVMLCVFYTKAQDDSKLQAIVLDSVLTKNANAIVRSEEVVIEVNSVNSMIVKTKRIVTVLNKLGVGYADSFESYDPSRKIIQIEARIYNSFGKEIKKYKKSDFKDRSMYDGSSLARDDRMKYFDYTPVGYPYTLAFESEVKWENTAFIPYWKPVLAYFLSIENSSYKILNPKQIDLRSQEVNFDGYPIKVDKSDHEISYSIDNIPVKLPESHSPIFNNMVPRVRVALNYFNLEGVEGTATDWKSFGKWEYDNLISGRDKLPKETVEEINLLVSGVKTKREKTKRIYEYVQNKTRYISVQLGIGGYMPMTAEDVDRLKYGDCKALTNYTMALLKTQKIESYYTLVFAKEKENIDQEFASLQGNHAILNVPDEEEDIWLECTSQTAPFDFIGDFTDDRNVLVIKPEGGEIKRTKKYLPKENTLVTKAEVYIRSDKSMMANVHSVSKGLQYDWRYQTKLQSIKDQRIHYKEYWDYITNLNIQSLDLNDNKDAPKYEEKLVVTADNYCSKAGSRLLVTPNVFNRDTSTIPKYEERKTPLVISRGYVDKDEYIIHIPKEYSVDKIPEEKTLDTQFGKYSWGLERISESQIKFKRSLEIKDGVFPKEEYEKYRQFKSKIKKIDKSKIVLKQKI